MGTILASAIVTSARITLLDPTPGATWTDATFLILFNEALRKMVLVKPEVYIVQGTVDLVAGAHQALPAGGTQVVEMLQNIASKKYVAQVSKSLLIESARFATPATEQVDVENYAYDSRDNARFMVWPPNNGSGQLIGSYGDTPSIAALSNALPIDDMFESAVKYLLLSECYAADSTRKDTSKAAYWNTQAMQVLGLNSQSSAALAPKPGSPGGQ